MVIPRHHACDFCGKNLGDRRDMYYIIKSKHNTFGTTKHDICPKCMDKIIKGVENYEKC